jgi:hypothetical protein
MLRRISSLSLVAQFKRAKNIFQQKSRLNC